MKEHVLSAHPPNFAHFGHISVVFILNYSTISQIIIHKQF